MAGALFGGVQVSLFVPGALFGDVQVLLFVAGALFGDVQVSLFVAGAIYLVMLKCHFSWQAQHSVAFFNTKCSWWA